MKENSEKSSPSDITRKLISRKLKQKTIKTPADYKDTSKPIITRTKRKTKTPIQTAEIKTNAIELHAESMHRQKQVTINTSHLASIKSIPAMLRDISSQPDDKTQHVKLYAMLLKAYEQAIEGDAIARSFIADRLEGKAVQRQLIQNIDIINKVIGVLERVITNPLPSNADTLLMMIIYELDKIAKQDEEILVQ